MATAGLEIRLMGTPQFRLDGGTIASFATRKAQAILIYLVQTGRPCARDVLTALFWPELPDTDARNNLRRTLPGLRQQFGPYLAIDREKIGFVRNRPVWLDTEELTTVLREQQPDATPGNLDIARLEAALDLYTAEFLAGFGVASAPAFEEWVLFERENLRELTLRGLKSLTDHFVQTRQIRRGLDASQRLLTFEPLHETGYQQRMMLLAWNGERAAALQQYALCQRMLADEFGLPPSGATTALYERIKAGALEPPPSADDAAPAQHGETGGESTALLPAKIARPGYTQAMVDRPRLYRRLDAWRSLRGIAVYAAAGYGKSSLVSRWLDVAGLAGQAAWINLDESDADPKRFVYYVAAALETVRPGALDLVRPMLADQHGDAGRALQRLVSSFTALAPRGQEERHLLLVLDDLHRVQSPAVDALILTLLEHGPPTLHLVLLARSRTEVKLARLHVQEKLVTLTAGDLRFTEEEVGAYLAAKEFGQSTAADLAELARRSEGWVTALQLAVLSLHHAGDVHELIDTLQGSHEWLAEYLVSEVLDRQAPEVQQFLLATSILDEFNAPLCAALTGDADAYARLTALKKADLFLIRLNAGDGWFRYHHLFQELLQHRLMAAVNPAILAGLHRRAAAWLQDHGGVPAAVRHLLAAGDEEAAAALVEAHVHSSMLHAPYEAKRFCDHWPITLLNRRPQLMLDRCFLGVVVDDPKMPELVKEASATLAEHKVSSHTSPTWHGEWLCWNAVVAYRRDEIREADQLLDRAAPYRDRIPDHVWGLAEFVRMHLRNAVGRHRAADECGEQAMAAFSRAGFDIGKLALQRELARWWMRAGKGADAERSFQQLFDSQPVSQPAMLRNLIHTYLVAAQNSYLLNHLDLARTYQETMMRLSNQLQDDELIAIADILGRSITVPKSAIDLSPEEVASWSTAITMLGISHTAHFLQIYTLIAAGHVELAWQTAEQIRYISKGLGTEPVRLTLLTWLYAYVARGVDLEAISPLLDDGLRNTATTNARLYHLQLLALQAWQLLQLRRSDAAAPVISAAEQLARQTGFVRVLLDIPALAEFVPQLRTSPRSPAPNSHASSVTADLLTRQEIQVLTLLAEHEGYQQIADELMVSINTVRTHMRHLYRKLGVNSRSGALEAAHRLGYLADSPRQSKLRG